MRSARHTLLIFLEKRGGTASLKEIEKELRDKRVVGNGAEPINVIHAAGRDKQLIYDPKTQTATLTY